MVAQGSRICLWCRDTGSIPGSGTSPGEGHGNPLQYSYLENPTDRRSWGASVQEAAKNQTWLKWLSSSSIPLSAHHQLSAVALAYPVFPVGQQTLVWFPCPWPDCFPLGALGMVSSVLVLWWDHMLNVLTFITFRILCGPFHPGNSCLSTALRNLYYIIALMSSLLLSVFFLWNSSSQILYLLK